MLHDKLYMELIPWFVLSCSIQNHSHAASSRIMFTSKRVLQTKATNRKSLKVLKYLIRGQLRKWSVCHAKGLLKIWIQKWLWKSRKCLNVTTFMYFTPVNWETLRILMNYPFPFFLFHLYMYPVFLSINVFKQMLPHAVSLMSLTLILLSCVYKYLSLCGSYLPLHKTGRKGTDQTAVKRKKRPIDE